MSQLDESRVAPQQITVSALVLKRILSDYLACRSVEWSAVARAAHVSGTNFESVDARITPEEERRLWRQAERLTVDPHVGLHAGANAGTAALDVLGYAMKSSATLGDALNVAARYHGLVDTGLSVRFVRSGAEARFSAELPAMLVPGSRHPVECALAAVVEIGRDASGARWAPIAVRFQHAAEAGTAEPRRFFRAPLRYGCERSELVIRASDLELPLRERDPDLGAILERHAADVLARLATDPDLVARVRRGILEVLGRSNVSLGSTARRLGFGARTLQRRLREHGTSHHTLLDGLRREFALAYLARGELDVQEVAFLLGFTRPSAFHRAFKRWTGTTPGDYRHARLSHGANTLT